jgi:hypothetical protein
MINTTHFPAQQITQKYKYDVQNHFYTEWISDLPDGHICQFVEYGLFPFLKRHGYTIYHTIQKVASCIEEWAFHHVLLTQYGSKYKSITYLSCEHDGGIDEKDWYHHKISVDDWSHLCSSWAATDFLDDSDTGRSQQLDLSDAIWNLISLMNSPSHHMWQQTMDSLNYQEDSNHWNQYYTEESSAQYGGERK